MRSCITLCNVRYLSALLAFAVACGSAFSSTLPLRFQYPLPTLKAFDGMSVCTKFQAPAPGELSNIASLGFKWIRNDLSWGAIEYYAGQYDFSKYDQLLIACQASGIRINFIIGGGNPIY